MSLASTVYNIVLGPWVPPAAGLAYATMETDISASDSAGVLFAKALDFKQTADLADTAIENVLLSLQYLEHVADGYLKLDDVHGGLSVADVEASVKPFSTAMSSIIDGWARFHDDYKKVVVEGAAAYYFSYYPTTGWDNPRKLLRDEYKFTDTQFLMIESSRKGGEFDGYTINIKPPTDKETKDVSGGDSEALVLSSADPRLNTFTLRGVPFIYDPDSKAEKDAVLLDSYVNSGSYMDFLRKYAIYYSTAHYGPPVLDSSDKHFAAQVGSAAEWAAVTTAQDALALVKVTTTTTTTYVAGADELLVTSITTGQEAYDAAAAVLASAQSAYSSKYADGYNNTTLESFANLDFSSAPDSIIAKWRMWSYMSVASYTAGIAYTTTSGGYNVLGTQTEVKFQRYVLNDSLQWRPLLHITGYSLRLHDTKEIGSINDNFLSNDIGPTIKWWAARASLAPPVIPPMGSDIVMPITPPQGAWRFAQGSVAADYKVAVTAWERAQRKMEQYVQGVKNRKAEATASRTARVMLGDWQTGGIVTLTNSMVVISSTALVVILALIPVTSPLALALLTALRLGIPSIPSMYKTEIEALLVNTFRKYAPSDWEDPQVPFPLAGSEDRVKWEDHMTVGVDYSKQNVFFKMTMNGQPAYFFYDYVTDTQSFGLMRNLTDIATKTKMSAFSKTTSDGVTPATGATQSNLVVEDIGPQSYDIVYSDPASSGYGNGQYHWGIGGATVGGAVGGAGVFAWAAATSTFMPTTHQFGPLVFEIGVKQGGNPETDHWLYLKGYDGHTTLFANNTNAWGNPAKIAKT